MKRNHEIWARNEDYAMPRARSSWMIRYFFVHIAKNIHRSPNISSSRPSKYCVAVPENFSGLGSGLPLSNLTQKCLSSESNRLGPNTLGHFTFQFQEFSLGVVTLDATCFRLISVIVPEI